MVGCTRPPAICSLPQAVSSDNSLRVAEARSLPPLELGPNSRQWTLTMKVVLWCRVSRGRAQPYRFASIDDRLVMAWPIGQAASL